MHGGKTPRGPGSVHFKDGRYSAFLPSRMFAQAQAAAQDPELMSLRHDIALTDARIIDLLKRVDTGEAGVVWRAAQAAMTRFERAKATQDVEGMGVALAAVQRLLTQGVADEAAWNEIGDLIEQRRKLVESEQRRLTLAHEVLNLEQAMALLGQVIDIIKRHVPDRQVLQAMVWDLQALGYRHNGHEASADPRHCAC